MKRIMQAVYVTAVISSSGALAEGADSPIIGRNLFGLATDFQADPVVRDNRSISYASADGEYAIEMDGVRLTFSSFKHDIGAVYLTRHHRRTGEPVDTVSVDASGVDGISHPAGGLVTPWQTVLLGENVVVDAARPDGFVASFKPYFKDRADRVEAYHYGWPFEVVTQGPQDDGKVIKHYAMGRIAPNLAVIMPDSKTVYLLDSQHAGYLYRFVASDAESLSDGRLEVARLDGQRVSWLLLADTSSLKAKFKLKNVQQSKLIKLSPAQAGQCAGDARFIETLFGQECVEPRDERYAGLFEPIRVAASLGASAFSKGADSMTLDVEKNTLVIRWASGEERSFALATDYQLQEML